MTDEQLKAMTKDEANKTLSYEDKTSTAFTSSLTDRVRLIIDRITDLKAKKT